MPKEAMRHVDADIDRKSTRLNSSHLGISYAVFCLKKEKSLSCSCSAAPGRAPWLLVFCCGADPPGRTAGRRVGGRVRENGWGLAALYAFFNDTAPTEIYTLSLHDALPISHVGHDALGDDRRDLARVILNSTLQGWQIIPGHNNRVFERGAIQAGTVGNLDGIGAQSQSTWRQDARTHEQLVVPAPIVSLEF